MKILYIDCSMGAAGDMLTAALSELHPDPDGFFERLNALGIPGVKVTRESSVKCGITGTHVRVTVDGEEEDEHMHEHTHGHVHHHHDHDHEHEHDHEHTHAHSHDNESVHTHNDHENGHHHSGMEDIRKIVGALALPEKVKDDILSVYGLIAQAESMVHGRPVDRIHFHEVGTMDAVADITAVCMLISELAPDRVVASPVHVGSGQVKCAHGILPVPAPATAHILRGVPIYGGSIQGELCTPTGAALLRHFADSFSAMPVMIPEKTGYGMGKKDFPAANCVLVMMGTVVTDETVLAAKSAEPCITELSFNVDDMTAEQLAFACERLFDVGAKDVFSVPVVMKKGRLGTMVCVLCDSAKRTDIVAEIFRQTSTLGIREHAVNRYTLERGISVAPTPYGNISIKYSQGYGVKKSKIEYEDIKRLALKNGMSFEDMRAALEKHIDMTEDGEDLQQ